MLEGGAVMMSRSGGVPRVRSCVLATPPLTLAVCGDGGIARRHEDLLLRVLDDALIRRQAQLSQTGLPWA